MSINTLPGKTDLVLASKVYHGFFGDETKQTTSDKKPKPGEKQFLALIQQKNNQDIKPEALEAALGYYLANEDEASIEATPDQLSTFSVKVCEFALEQEHEGEENELDKLLSKFLEKKAKKAYGPKTNSQPVDTAKAAAAVSSSAAQSHAVEAPASNLGRYIAAAAVTAAATGVTVGFLLTPVGYAVALATMLVYAIHSACSQLGNNGDCNMAQGSQHGAEVPGTLPRCGM